MLPFPDGYPSTPPFLGCIQEFFLEVLGAPNNINSEHLIPGLEDNYQCTRRGMPQVVPVV